MVNLNIGDAILYVDGKLADISVVKVDKNGFFQIDLAKGKRALFIAADAIQNDLVINPLNIEKSQQNLFGLNDKTTRLPSYKYYYSE